MDRLPVADDDDEIVTIGEPLAQVEHVEVSGPLTLSVRFDDGVSGTVRFAQGALVGVFEKLKDPDYFRRVGIVWGAVSWPDEDPDLAPDAMHDDLIAANGELVLN